MIARRKPASARLSVVTGLLLAGFGSAVGAQTLALTPDEKAAVLARNTEASVDAARAGEPDPALPGARARRLSGAIGATIGSHGARGAYGVAAIPLGESASATVSFDDERYGRERRR